MIPPKWIQPIKLCFLGILCSDADDKLNIIKHDTEDDGDDDAYTDWNEGQENIFILENSEGFVEHLDDDEEGSDDKLNEEDGVDVLDELFPEIWYGHPGWSGFGSMVRLLAIVVILETDFIFAHRRN